MSGQIKTTTRTTLTGSALVISQYQYRHIATTCQIHSFLYGFLFSSCQRIAHQFIFRPPRINHVDPLNVVDFYVFILIYSFKSVQDTIKTLKTHRTIVRRNVIVRVGVGTNDSYLTISVPEGKHVVGILQQYKAFA